MKRTSGALVLLVASTLAGCASPNATDAVDAMAAVAGRMADVPCQADVPAEATSDNVAVLAQVPLMEGLGAEIDVVGDILLLGRKGPGGFDVFDISDPLHPERLAEVFHDEGFSTRDVKFAPDGRTLFVPTGGLTIDIYDLGDPSAPVRTGTFAIPSEPGRLRDAHMVWPERIGGEDWLFVATLSNEGVWVYRITGEPGDVGVEYVAQTSPVQGGPLGVHDMWVTVDDAADETWLYSADGFLGWSVWNVDDPTAPVLLSALPNLDPFQSYTHTVQAQWIDGRRIVATIAEVGHNALKVYDATDIATPLLLGTWQADPVSDPTTPQHNVNLVDGRLYMAHYTRGAYVFDLRELTTTPLGRLAGLEPVARFVGEHAAGSGPVAWDEFWDIVLVDGVLYTADYWGLHVIGYGCLTPGDPAQTSVG